MNIEQRLLHAFEQADLVEPSPDLWSRVVHSIEEDRLHRKRLLRTAAGVGASGVPTPQRFVLASSAAAGAPSEESSSEVTPEPPAGLPTL